MLRLEQQCVILDLQATEKESVLNEMAAAIHASCPHIDITAMNRVLVEREQLGSTGIGNGVAIPHCKLYEMKNLLLYLGRSRNGINFDAVDKHPVHLIVMLLSPKNMAEEYLQALAHVSRTLKNKTIRNNILEAASSQEIVDLFNQCTTN